MGKKPARRRGARRLNITPKLKADIRRRYEHTPERLGTMAADCGCCGETVRAMAKREGWVRYEPPPRDLSPAARLRMRAEALSQHDAVSLYPPLEGEGRETERSEDERGGVSEQGSSPPPGAFGADLPPPGGGEEREAGGGEESSADNAPDPAAIATQMLHEVRGFLDDIRAKRKRMKREGYAKHELQAVSRVIADCSASLQRLQLTAQRAAAAETNAQQTDQETAYDDVPADLDEFRNELARQIDALFEDAPDEGDRAQAADGAAAAPAT